MGSEEERRQVLHAEEDLPWPFWGMHPHALPLIRDLCFAQFCWDTEAASRRPTSSEHPAVVRKASVTYDLVTMGNDLYHSSRPLCGSKRGRSCESAFGPKAPPQAASTLRTMADAA
jgi:hypothetical protein